MSLTIHQADYFWADLLKQVDWYRHKASPEVSERYDPKEIKVRHPFSRTRWTRG